MSGNGNEPAWPVECSFHPEDGTYRGRQTSTNHGFVTGLSKREYFAGLAMAAIAPIYAAANNVQPANGIGTGHFLHNAPIHAVRLADALLSALSEGAP